MIAISERPKIRFQPSGRTAEVRYEGEDLLSIANRSGVELDSVCGGKGTCGRCRVIVRSQESALTEEEREHLTPQEIARGMRLACQVVPTSDLTVEVPEDFTRGGQVILEEASADIVANPVIRSVVVKVPRPTLDNQVADLERLLDSLTEEADVSDISLLRSLPNLLKDDEEFKVILREGEILDLVPMDSGTFGVAVDIGTTTVVAYLMELTSGEVRTTRSTMNPQISHGDDVISRITYSMEKEEGLATLQREISECLNGLIEESALAEGVRLSEIHEVVAVGNTAMHHLFLGIDPRSLALSPYIPVVDGPVNVRAEEIGLRMGRGYVHLLPNIAGFVGADHVAVLLASRLWEMKRPTMVIDIGTNGEISIGNRGRIVSASCAAGPAFEGASLKCGIRGIPGAIDHLSIDDDLEVHYSTIGGLRAKGICGSGAVDSIWEMFRTGVIDASGRIMEELDSDRIQVTDGQSEFVIARANETATGEPVVITQDDIVSIQYAKAALFVGATLLMKEMGINKEDLDLVLLAGAFGNYVSIESTRNLGVIPEIPLDRIRSIGNAAGAGARVALMNRDSRKMAGKLARSVDYLELAAHPEFEERFYEAMFIPHFDTSLFPEVTTIRARIG